MLHLSVSANKNTPFSNSQYKEIEGICFHYRLFTPEKDLKGSLLLVHGLGGSTFSFRHNIKSFLEVGYQVLAVDLPAFGYSDRKRGLTHSQENRSRWLWQLLDSISPPVCSWHLGGHSMGGGTITAMALQEPERVSSLIYIAGAVGDYSSRRRVLSFPPFKQVLSLFARWFFFRQGIIERVLASAYGTAPGKEDIQGYLEPLQVKGTARALSDLVGTSTGISLDLLENLRIPALLIWGEEDHWVPLETGQALNQALPLSHLYILPGVGHVPQETNPKEVNEIIQNFLENINKN